MEHGPVLPEGFLPVYSVADAEEARNLIILTCSTNYNGEYIASELAHEQTLENLDAFSDRLDEAHTWMAARGNCRCTPHS